MARFLSPAWADDLNAALEGVVVPGPGPMPAWPPSTAGSPSSQEVRGAPGR